jgi:peptidoglycan/LPS O-acetylase OafA/YrhL
MLVAVAARRLVLLLPLLVLVVMAVAVTVVIMMPGQSKPQMVQQTLVAVVAAPTKCVTAWCQRKAVPVLLSSSLKKQAL